MINRTQTIEMALRRERGRKEKEEEEVKKEKKSEGFKNKIQY